MLEDGKRGRGRPTKLYTMDEATCIQDALIAYEEEGRIGQTLRHYYYKLLSSGAIVLSKASGAGAGAYKALSKYMTKARDNGSFPWGGIVDPSRRSYTHYTHESINDYIGSQRYSAFTLDVWRGQPTRIEIWVEKDGLAEFMNDAVYQYRMPVYINKGYPSTTILYDAAMRYKGTGNNGEDWLVLYCGDFDPSGLDIERHIKTGLAKYGVNPTIHRIALTLADTKELPQLAALDIKMDDPRAKAFIQEYGIQQKGYELEALKASVLKRKVLAAIEAVMDMQAFETALAFEKFIHEQEEEFLRGASNRFVGYLNDAIGGGISHRSK